MKFWNTEHTFEHPWETVVTAALRKYPNPMNPAVVGLDVVDRHVDKNGVLVSHRLMATKWGMPDFVKRFLHIADVCYGSEHSEVDPVNKKMKLRTRNLTYINNLTIDEYLSYHPHPDDPKKTQLTQKTEVTIKGMPLGSYLEKLITDNMSSNAKKGRAAIEWVIEKLKTEAEELRLETMKSVDKLLVVHTADDKKKNFNDVNFNDVIKTAKQQKQHS